MYDMHMLEKPIYMEQTWSNISFGNEVDESTETEPSNQNNEHEDKNATRS